MAHQITSTDELFSTRMPTWHGLGHILPEYPSREEAQQIAHPWEPISEPVYRSVPYLDEKFNPPLPAERMEPIDGFKAVVRSDNGHTLGIMGDGYEPVKNDTLWDIAEAVQGSGVDVQYETAGSLDGGKKVWVLLKLQDPINIKGDPNGETLPYFALQNSHDGSGAFRGQALVTRIVCHAAGTPVLHKGEWISVENHPGVMGRKRESGLNVHIEGLPFPETVTLDHLYRNESMEWIKARELVSGESEIAYPVGEFDPHGMPDLGGLEDDPDTWWAVGLWWGDGNEHGRLQVTWSVANTRQDIKDRLLGWMRRHGFSGEGSARAGCWQYTWSNAVLRQFLTQWYVGEGRGKGGRSKVPPVAVEYAPRSVVSEIVQGYWDADGSRDARGGLQWSSSSLDGLLALRRMLARLGRVSSIRRARKGTRVMTVAGHEATVRPSWTLRQSPNPQGVRIEDGVIYSRVRLVEWVNDAEFIPLDCSDEDNEYTTHFGRSHNCANTARVSDLEARARGTEFTFRHTKKIGERIEEARMAVAGWRQSLEDWRILSEHLLTLEAPADARREFLERFIPEPAADVISERVRNNIAQARRDFMDVLYSPTCEGIVDTASGLVAAATEYAEHVRRAHTKESRFTRSFLARNQIVADATRIALEVSR